MNLANVLHRAHFSADAAILVHAALDVSTDFLTSHYTLGNIYAVSTLNILAICFPFISNTFTVLCSTSHYFIILMFK